MSDPLALLDINVLIAMSWPRHIHHDRAHRWFGGRGGAPWATTPLTEAGYLRLSVNPAVVHRSLPMAAAVSGLRAMRGVPGHQFVPDTSSLTEPVIEVTRLVTGRQVTDVHLVNLAAAAGGVLATLDKAIPTYLEPDDRQYVRLVP